MIKIPMVAYAAFCNDFPNLINEAERQYYYVQQDSMKWCFGCKATIKFIKD